MPGCTRIGDRVDFSLAFSGGVWHSQPMPNSIFAFLAILCLGAGTVTSSGQTFLVFTNNFDGALPQEIQPGKAFLTGVQGYAGLGTAGNQFSNSFLRSETANLVTLTLS